MLLARVYCLLLLLLSYISTFVVTVKGDDTATTSDDKIDHVDLREFTEEEVIMVLAKRRSYEKTHINSNHASTVYTFSV